MRKSQSGERTKADQRKNKARKYEAGSKEVSNRSPGWHHSTQMHPYLRATWKKELICTITENLLRYGSRMRRRHTCSFLSAAAHVEIIATRWVWEMPRQTHRRSMDESTAGGRGRNKHSIPWEGSMKRSSVETNVTASVPSPDRLVSGTFAQNRWQLRREKEDVPWQAKKNFLCAEHPQWKKKNGTYGSHHASCLNPL